MQAIREAAAPCWPQLVVEVVAQIDSSNTELMRRAKSGNSQPALLVAEQQTAGRGRLGRNWQSEPGASLTFSLGLPLAPQDWSGLSLAVGVALAESLHPDVHLKWPNDLWFADRKLGGILIETASFGRAGEAGRYAVIGVGINIAQRAWEGVSTAPAWLREVLPDVGAAQALLQIIRPLLQAVQAFESFGFGVFQSRFDARDALRDREVALTDGTLGTAHGITDAGALLVHTAGGMRLVTSAEVSVRPTQPPQ